MPSISKSLRRDVAAGILCGGRSRRMGQSKAMLPGRGQHTLIDLATDRVADAFEFVVLLFADPTQVPDLPGVQGAEMAFDAVPSSGPVAGIASGLHWASERGARGLLVAPIDMPSLTLGDQLRLLPTASNTHTIRVAMDTVSGQLQPLVGYYPVDLAEAMQCHAASAERSMMRLLDQIEHERIEFPPDRLLNLNTPDDYQAWIASQ
ncbi:MAG: molybdenum cofactor guanylyltransferase [Planctomycetota bacterium]